MSSIVTMKGCGSFAQKTGCPKNLAAIFFDLDNTLIPTRKGDSKACRKLVEILDKQHGISREEGEQITDKFLRSFRSCPDNPQTSLDSWRSYLWSQALPQNYSHLSDVIYKNWLQLRYRYLAITAEYESMLRKLGKMYLLALITNGPSNGQWEKINKLNVSQYFDCVLVSADLPWEKPNPNIFLAACNILNVKPEQCLMIGDKLQTDIQGGKDAHLGGTVWTPITNDYDANSVTPKPDVIVKNLVEIFNYLPATTSAAAIRNHLRRPIAEESMDMESDVDMEDEDETAGTSNRKRVQRRHSQSIATSSTTSSRRYYNNRRHVSYPEIEFNDSSCDCS